MMTPRRLESHALSAVPRPPAAHCSSRGVSCGSVRAPLTQIYPCEGCSFPQLLVLLLGGWPPTGRDPPGVSENDRKVGPQEHEKLRRGVGNILKISGQRFKPSSGFPSIAFTVGLWVVCWRHISSDICAKIA